MKKLTLFDAYEIYLTTTLIEIIPLASLETAKAWSAAYMALLPWNFGITGGLSLAALTAEALAHAEVIPSIRSQRKALLGIPVYIFNLKSIGVIVDFAENGFDDEREIIASNTLTWSIIAVNFGLSFFISLVNFLHEKYPDNLNKLTQLANTAAYASMIASGLSVPMSALPYQLSPAEQFLGEWVPSFLVSFSIASLLTNIESGHGTWLKQCFSVEVNPEIIRPLILGLAAVALAAIRINLRIESFNDVDDTVLNMSLAAVLFSKIMPFLVYFGCLINGICASNNEEQTALLREAPSVTEVSSTLFAVNHSPILSNDTQEVSTAQTNM